MTDPQEEKQTNRNLPPVKKRLVLNFPGFEKTDSEAQLGRIQYCAENTGSIWGFSISEPSLATDAGKHHTFAGFETTGADWKTQTDVVQFRWNDIVNKYEDAPFPKGFFRDLWKFLAFFTDGTVLKYQRTSGRYFAFTIFPFLLMAIFALFVWFLIGWFVEHAVLKVVMTAAATLMLCKWPGEKLYVPLTVADWGFARDMVNQSNPEIEARFEEFAETLFQQILASDHDEIIIVGHSFGAVWAVSALGRALSKGPEFIQGKPIRILALGSSIPKIALASQATWLREQMNTVLQQESLFWHEFQTKDDLIAFYKSHPFEALSLNWKCGFALDRMRFSKGMDKKRYRQMRRSFYQTHRQYILYYDKRVGFDYMLRLFGPFTIPQLADMDDPTKALDSDGRLL